MNVREEVTRCFPRMLKTRNSLFQLASVFWSRTQTERLEHVYGWQDLIDMDVDNIGGSGIGALLNFMEPDMAVAYIPAWLVIAYERPFLYAGVMPALMTVLDDQQERRGEGPKRFQTILEYLNTCERRVIGDVFAEIAEVHFRYKPDMKAELERLAKFWREQAEKVDDDK